MAIKFTEEQKQAIVNYLLYNCFVQGCCNCVYEPNNKKYSVDFRCSECKLSHKPHPLWKPHPDIIQRAYKEIEKIERNEYGTE